MRNVKNILTIVLISIVVNSFAESGPKLVKKGDHYFQQHNYHKALEYYEQALLELDHDKDLLVKIGVSYTKIGQSGKALEFLDKAENISAKPTKDLLLAKADAHHKNYQFDQAIKYYKKWDPANGKSKEGDYLIRQCEQAKLLTGKPVKAKVTLLESSANSSFPDYLPKITAGGEYLYFTSRRDNSTGGKLAPDGLYYEDIYWCSSKAGFKDINQLTMPLNSADHDALVGMSGNGHTMLLYKGTNGGDLYISDYDGKKWSKPEPLPSFINTTGFESSASVSPDGRTLYYVHAANGSSNRDIFMCKRTHSGNWSKPVKIGGINTAYNEESPFIHPDGKTLYFSSKGHNSMGGYDIFKTVKDENGKWGKPINLGFPINTPEDDLYFVLSANGKTAYYSSSRKGGKGFQDIYTIKMPYVKKNLTLFKTKVLDGDNKPVCADVTITNNQTKKVYMKGNTDCKNGMFTASLPSGQNYGIKIEAEGYLFQSENVYLDENSGYNEFKKKIEVQKIKKDGKLVLNNIFFDSGESTLKEESKLELSHLIKILNDNPTLKIEISGHTDNVGNPGSNLLLSQKRAKSVMQYLIQHKISSSRLKAIGQGSKFPVADNKTELGRLQNRRTEIKFIAL